MRPFGERSNSVGLDSPGDSDRERVRFPPARDVGLGTVAPLAPPTATAAPPPSARPSPPTALEVAAPVTPGGTEAGPAGAAELSPPPTTGAAGTVAALVDAASALPDAPPAPPRNPDAPVDAAPPSSGDEPPGRPSGPGETDDAAARVGPRSGAVPSAAPSPALPPSVLEAMAWGADPLTAGDVESPSLPAPRDGGEGAERGGGFLPPPFPPRPTSGPAS